MGRKNSRKLRLELDALEVESFTPAEPRGERGTVQAREGSLECTYDYTCYYRYTCNGYDNSCYPTCQHVETCLEFC